MNTYIIIFDAIAGSNVNALLDAIKSYGTWAHSTESSYIISTKETCTEVRDHLKQFLSSNSRLLVVKSASVAAWKNTICSNEWLKKNL